MFLQSQSFDLFYNQKSLVKLQIKARKLETQI